LTIFLALSLWWAGSIDDNKRSAWHERAKGRRRLPPKDGERQKPEKEKGKGFCRQFVVYRAIVNLNTEHTDPS
jgi:hypothetical protein